MGISDFIDAPSVGEVAPAPGHVLLLYTGGTIEARNEDGEQFGLDQLAAGLEHNATLSGDELIRAIEQDVREFANTADLKQHDGRLADGVTLLVIKQHTSVTTSSPQDAEAVESDGRPQGPWERIDETGRNKGRELRTMPRA